MTVQTAALQDHIPLNEGVSVEQQMSSGLTDCPRRAKRQEEKQMLPLGEQSKNQSLTKISKKLKLNYKKTLL